jgi:uncharacterized protein (DUF2147 family)
MDWTSRSAVTAGQSVVITDEKWQQVSSDSRPVSSDRHEGANMKELQTAAAVISVVVVVVVAAAAAAAAVSDSHKRADMQKKWTTPPKPVHTTRKPRK